MFRSLVAGALVLLAFATALPSIAVAATSAGTDGTAATARSAAGSTAASAGGAPRAGVRTSASTLTNPETPVPVEASNTPPVGRFLSADQVLEIANRLPKLRKVRAEYPGSYGGAYLKGPTRWQVSYFSRRDKEIGQAIIADRTGRVLEQWTGFQIAWTMARGYPGAFGRHVNSLYVWIPLCLLFFLPFFDWRNPLRLLHLDLLALLSFSLSLAFFNHGDIGLSTPLAYPPLLYLLARMLAVARVRLRSRARRAERPERAAALLIPTPWLAIALLFLIGFRVGLNVTDSNVIDVGYAGAIGAQRMVQGRSLYGGYPADNEHGDTYGPATYAAYVPFEQLLGFSGHWDDLPAAHAAAICFDLLAIALLFALGLRIRGPSMGIALAYAWAAYPFTLFALESNSNDTLVAVLVLAALLLAASPPARGVFAALAGLAKFAPLALAPLLATHGLRDPDSRYLAHPPRRRGAPTLADAGAPMLAAAGAATPRSRRRGFIAVLLFSTAFAATVALLAIPALAHDSLHTIYERTLAYQSDRESPFSIWGLYGVSPTGGPAPAHWLSSVQLGVELATVALALALALLPRREDAVGLAAAAAAILIAVQLGIDHWFYLYIPWFFGLAMLALLGQVNWAPAPRRRPARRRAASDWSPSSAGTGRSLAAARGGGAGHQDLLDRVGP